MAMLARETNLKQNLFERVGWEKMAYKKEENYSEFDFNIVDREHGWCVVQVECEDEES